MADSQLRIIIDALWKGKGDARAARGDIQGLGQATQQADIRMAAMGQRSSLLQSKMKSLGREVALGTKSVDEATGEFNRFKEGLADLGEEAAGGKSSLSGLVSVAAQGAAVFGTITVAIRQVYQAIGEGAQLELAATRFDKLSASIGTTGDALRSGLREATQGLLTDAEAVQLAGDLMALGLANTEEKAVRLTAVASQLGMNINQLVLTLTNRTTARFDQLGVSVAGFEERLKGLEEQGYSTNEAFTEAFLQQAEEQIERVGSVADTTAGEIQKFEASFRQLSDTMKVAAAKSARPWFESVNELIDAHRELERLQDLGIIENWERVQTIEKGALFGAAAIREQVDAFGEQLRAAESADRVLLQYAKSAREAADATSYAGDAWENAKASLEEYDAQLRQTGAYEARREGIDSTAALWDQMVAQYEAEQEAAEEARQAVEALNQARDRVVAGGIGDQARIIGELGQAWEDYATGVEGAQERIDEATGQMAAGFEQMALDMLMTTGGFDQVAADYAVALGLMDRTTADLRLASQDAAAAIGEISTAVDEGDISPERAARFIQPIVEAMQSGEGDIAGIIESILADFRSLTSAETDLSGFDETTQRMVEKLEAADKNAGLLSDTVGGMDTSQLETATETSGELEETLGRIQETDWEAAVDYNSVSDALTAADELALALDKATRERTAIINVEYGQSGTGGGALPGPTGPTPGVPANVPQYAGGTRGIETVPGPPGRPFLTMLHGGEQFWVGQRGEQPSGGERVYQDNRTINLNLYDAGSAAVAAAHLDAEAALRWDRKMGVAQ